jgi:RND family efflux transporter MFP subunit
VHEAAVASKILARVTEVRVKAGQSVAAGDVVVLLEDSELQARRKQAEASVTAAIAAREKANKDYERAKALEPSGGISQEDLDHRAAARRTAAAELDRAEHQLSEAKALLEYATVRAPITGTVVDKRIEAGDMASPGQVLLTLYNPKRMQMVVTVPESLAMPPAALFRSRSRARARTGCTPACSAASSSRWRTSRSSSCRRPP